MRVFQNKINQKRKEGINGNKRSSIKDLFEEEKKIIFA